MIVIVVKWAHRRCVLTGGKGLGYLETTNFRGNRVDLTSIVVMIRGAGEMASATAWRLHMSHIRVVMTEIPKPLAVRRKVSFCEAIYEGTAEVEGVVARLIDSPDQVESTIQSGELPLLIDPDLSSLGDVKPQVVVDATLAKRNMGIERGIARHVIGLGPGFIAEEDVDVVIETNRGHNLGRIITAGPAEPNTGVPGTIGGQGSKRVLRAPMDGIFEATVELGDVVKVNQEVARVRGVPILSALDGVVRGLIRQGTPVSAGLKVGDVDPRGDLSSVATISDKARAVAGSVLEAVMRVFNH